MRKKFEFYLKMADLLRNLKLPESISGTEH